MLLKSDPLFPFSPGQQKRRSNPNQISTRLPAKSGFDLYIFELPTEHLVPLFAYQIHHFYWLRSQANSACLINSGLD